ISSGDSAATRSLSNATATTAPYTLSLHDALPICQLDGAPSTIRVLPEIVDRVGHKTELFLDSGIRSGQDVLKALAYGAKGTFIRSEEHTSELQSRENLVCRLLLEKKKKETRVAPI